MVTVSNIATQIENENNWTTGDIALANLEYLIDSIIDFINLECGTSIADLGGSGGSKTLTGTEDEIITVKVGSALMGRAYKNKGPQVNVMSLSVTEVITDPHYTFYSEMFKICLNRLRGRSILRT